MNDILGTKVIKKQDFSQEQEVLKQRPHKRICESSWHKEIHLEPFQECPRCRSKSYHKVVYLDI